MKSGPTYSKERLAARDLAMKAIAEHGEIAYLSLCGASEKGGISTQERRQFLAAARELKPSIFRIIADRFCIQLR